MFGINTSWVREPPAWIDKYFDSIDNAYGGVYWHAQPAPPTGEDTTATRTMLFPGGVGSADADAALEEILNCEQQVAAIQAQQIHALARFAQLRPDPDGTGRLVDSFASD
jgi:hypothetical protein